MRNRESKVVQMLNRYPAKNPAEEDLSALLQQVASYDRAAFKRLYDATSAKLLGIVLRIVKDRSRAEEIMQEVYIKIWERAELYNPDRGSPRAWMAIMARNMALDHVRAHLRLVSSTDSTEIEQIASDDEHPLDYCIRQQDRTHLLKCLETLEEVKKNMVVLAYQEGLSREELAERFDTPVATVKTWLRRSLESLRMCMSGYV